MADRRTLTITDLTYMWADEVCIAGVDSDGNTVRPVTENGVRLHDLFRDRELVVRPGARVEFTLSPTEITPPHIEDMSFETESVVSQGLCSADQWEQSLLSTCSPSVADVFDGYLEGRRVPPGARTRSLGTVRDARILNLAVDDRFNRRQFRVDFIDPTEQTYARYPINDLAFRGYFQKIINGARDVGRASRAVLRAIGATHRIYLRVGLARPRQIGDYPETCWAQVTAIHTFPDYLQGKTFADFV